MNTKTTTARTRDAGAEAIVLSGSTARDRRTRVSEVDFHVIGASSVRVADLPAGVDLYADDVNRFWSNLRRGDDFAHWSVWYQVESIDLRIGQVVWSDTVRRPPAPWKQGRSGSEITCIG
jgi:hypothetical protein